MECDAATTRTGLTPPGLPLQAGLEPHPGWRLHQFLGRGGFGEVWKAEKPGGEAVALKFMPAEKGLATAREIQSIQMVRQLCHPNLIQVERVWIYGSFIVVAMELAEGGLDDLLVAYQAEFGQPVPAEQVCLYLNQAAAALDFLNSRHHLVNGKPIAIQHCDVKPSNLLLFGETVKLADFGLSSVLSGAWKAHRRAGTPGFAAPEVALGQLSDRTDQFALAVTYCYLRTGRLPFPETPSRSGRSRPPSPVLTAFSPRERAILTRALDRVPQNRWPSCVELMSQLTSVVS